jgi:LmbE family N-acetylglucosaminyl deacetylase
MDSSATSEEQFQYGAVFLSPHLDDVALSCGGTIHQMTQRGTAVLVVSITTGDPPQGEISPFSENLHSRWQLAAGAIAERRSEDVKACMTLGADWLHWQVPDCIYRRNPENSKPLYASEEALFGLLDPSEMDLVINLAQQFDSLPSHDSIYVPLAVGNHVDHQITRLAAETQWDARSLFCYEEYPYSQVDSRITSALDDEGRWRTNVVRLEAQDIEARVRAIACYRSQISTFFTDLADMSDQVHRHIQKVGGERYWKRIS